MNNSTDSQVSQMPHNKAAASMGVATRLQSFLLPAHTTESKQAHMVKTGQIKPQEAPQPQETPKEVETPKEDKKDPVKDMELMFTTKLDEIRQELKKDNQREIDTLKKTITDALSEEDTNEPSKTA